ncbi:hypothetical protein Q5752_005017 [Cryptotrichosporon argae]
MPQHHPHPSSTVFFIAYTPIAMPITWPHGSSPASSTSSLSYPSDASSLSSLDTDDDDGADDSALIQEEWEESVRQLEMLLSVIVLPFFGKWFGRQWAFWAYDRYQRYGWTTSFVGLR